MWNDAEDWFTQSGRLLTGEIFSLSDLLIKDSTNLDPGRVINISSTASVGPSSEGALSADGNGTWSCMYPLCMIIEGPSIDSFFFPVILLFRPTKQGSRLVPPPKASLAIEF